MAEDCRTALRATGKRHLDRARSTMDKNYGLSWQVTPAKFFAEWVNAGAAVAERTRQQLASFSLIPCSVAYFRTSSVIFIEQPPPLKLRRARKVRTAHGASSFAKAPIFAEKLRRGRGIRERKACGAV